MNEERNKLIMNIEIRIGQLLDTMKLYKHKQTSDGLPVPEHNIAYSEWKALKKVSKHLQALSLEEAKKK